MTRPAPPRLCGDRGSVTTELVVVTPAAIALLCLVALVGRGATARQHVDEAARDAARAASLERDPAAARHAAHTAAATALTSGGTRCAASRVEVDTTAFHAGGQVTVTVACDIALSDLALIGVPGTRTVTATSVSVVDTYKAVDP
jgi:Flp pilus assembly protein TadG